MYVRACGISNACCIYGMRYYIAPRVLHFSAFHFSSIIMLLLALSLAHDKEKLLKEVTAMLSFSHPNVMSLIGMCFDGDLPMVIMPFMSNGSVLGYVKQKARELLFEGRENKEEEVCNSGDVNSCFILTVMTV